MSTIMAHTVDGRNPAPPNIYETLQIMGYLPDISTGGGFLLSTVCLIFSQVSRAFDSSRMLLNWGAGFFAQARSQLSKKPHVASDCQK